MFSFTASHKNPKEAPNLMLDEAQLKYVERILVLLCCTLFILDFFVARFREKSREILENLVKFTFIAAILYAFISHTPWKDVLQSLASAWIKKLLS